MKRLFYTCLAALAAAYTSSAAEETAAAPTTGDAAAPAAAETPEAKADGAQGGEDAAGEEEEASSTEGKDALEVMAAKNARLDQVYASIEKPNRATRDRYSAHTKDYKERLEKIEGIRKQVEELTAKKQTLLSLPYEFSIVPEESRYVYEQEGEELAKKVYDALNSKSETTQLEGLRRYGALKESYQGLPRFKEVTNAYQKVVFRLDKKWNTLRDNIKKERAKWPHSKLDKLMESERTQYDALVRKMESSDLNIDEVWFLPRGNNSLMLEKALEHSRRAKQSLQNKSVDVPNNVPQLLHDYWAYADGVRELMQSGNYEEASNKLSDDDSFRAVSSLSRYAMPEVYKDGIRKQQEDMRNELRRRKSEQTSLDREMQRATSSLEREMSNLDMRIDRVMESIEAAKEEEERRAAEAAEIAEREAAMKAEQERLDAEQAAEDEEADEDEEPVKPKKKKKGSKKKSREEVQE